MFLDWKVIKDDLFTLSEQREDFLNEDMFQASYKIYTIDCGWYEEGELGHYICFLIKEYNWESPIIKIITDNIEDAKWSVMICYEYCRDR